MKNCIIKRLSIHADTSSVLIIALKCIIERVQNKNYSILASLYRHQFLTALILIQK